MLLLSEHRPEVSSRERSAADVMPAGERKHCKRLTNESSSALQPQLSWQMNHLDFNFEILLVILANLQ